MSTIELKSNIHKIVDNINSEQLLQTIYSFLKTRERSRTGKLWRSLTSGQKKELLLSYEESEDVDNLIERDKVLKKSNRDVVTIVAAGVTLYEALKAYNELARQGIMVRVVDLYSIKPIDRTTLHQAAKQTKAIITVEDHFAAGGIGEAVRSALEPLPTPVYSLAVRKLTKSGTPEQLLAYEGINSNAIVRQVKAITRKK